MWDDLSVFFRENPAYVGFVGVLVGSMLNIGASRALHQDKVSRDDRSARRGLYGRYLAAVEERRSLTALLKRKERDLSASVGPMDFAYRMKNLKDAPEVVLRREALGEVDFRRREADKKAASLKFEILIEYGVVSKELEYVLNALRDAQGSHVYSKALRMYRSFCQWDLATSWRKRRALQRKLVTRRAEYEAALSPRPEEQAPVTSTGASQVGNRADLNG